MAPTTRLFGDILTVVGLEELVGSALAHIPVSRQLAENLGVPPVRPDQVVLRVAHDHAVDPELRSILDSLAGRGYALSLYDLPGPRGRPRSCSSCSASSSSTAPHGSDAELADAVARISAARATPLAVG